MQGGVLLVVLFVAALVQGAAAASGDSNHVDAGNVIAGLTGAVLAVVLILALIGWWARKQRGM